MIGQEIVEKQYVAVGKASTFVSLRPKGTIMVDGSTSIAPLMEVINVCTVAQLRTSLLLKSLEGRSDLIAKEIHRLAAYDKEKDTQYCETLYVTDMLSFTKENLRCPFCSQQYCAL